MIEPSSSRDRARAKALESLRSTAEVLKSAEREADRLRAQRDELLLRAVKHGATNVEAATAAGVTEGYVRKVRKR